MTVSSTDTVQVFNGNGSTSAFVVTFPFFEIEVVKIAANGSETVWTLGSQYTVMSSSGMPYGDGNTGTINVITAPTDYRPATGEKLRVQRKTTNTQTLTLAEGDAFPASTIEDTFDRSVMVAQELDRKISRAPKLSEADFTTHGELVMPTPQANRLLAWNATANGLVNKNPADFMAVATYDTDGDGVVDAAETAPWSGITGKPATFPATAHTHDDRYYTEGEVDAALAGKAAAIHAHAISDVTGLQSALDSKLSTVHNHDDRYYTEAETDALLATKAAATHGHAISDVTGLQIALDGKADSSHAHTIVDVTGLQTALDGKAASSHTHTIANVTGLQTALDNKLDDTQASVFGLSLLDDVDAATARTTLGLGSAATSAASAFAAASHTHAIADVTNLQTTLDGKAASSHTHTIANITGLQTALDNKLDDSQATAFGLSLLDDADAATARTTLGLGSAATQASTAFAAASHTHTIANVTGLQTALDNKLDDSQASVFGLSLIDDADAAAARTTLGLGTAATSASSAFATASHNHTLDSLSNVSITSLATDQYLKWNGTAWVNAAGGGGGSGATDLDGLTDVAITSPATGHVLRHNGTQFVNVLGTDHFAAASHTHTASQISDSTAAGRALLTGADAAAQRISLGLGTAALEGAGYFATANHTHTIANVTGLQTALDNKLDDSQATVFGLSLLDDADAATARTTLGLGTAATQASSAFAAASHSHVIADVTGLQTALDGKAASSHTHTIANITGLQTALDNKLDDSQASVFGLSLLDDADAATARTTLGLGTAATSAASAFAAASHNHTASQITDFSTAVAALAGFAKVRYKIFTNGAAYTPAADVKGIEVILTGAGASGGSAWNNAANVAAGGGGGAGGTLIFALAGAVLANTFTIGIGLGGAAATAQTSVTLQPGRAGGASTLAIGATVVATAGGGLAGAGGVSGAFGAGGAGGTNTVNATYLPAGSFISLVGQAGGVSNSFYATTTYRRTHSAAGGASFWGKNNAPTSTQTAATAVSGVAPTQYGAGSDGASVHNTVTTGVSAGATFAGANGVCVIKEYYV